MSFTLFIFTYLFFYYYHTMYYKKICEKRLRKWTGHLYLHCKWYVHVWSWLYKAAFLCHAIQFIVVSHLWIQDQTLGISETVEGLFWDLLWVDLIVFYVDRSQGGSRVFGMTNSPLVHSSKGHRNGHFISSSTAALL